MSAITQGNITLNEKLYLNMLFGLIPKRERRKPHQNPPAQLQEIDHQSCRFLPVQRLLISVSITHADQSLAGPDVRG